MRSLPFISAQIWNFLNTRLFVGFRVGTFDSDDHYRIEFKLNYQEYGSLLLHDLFRSEVSSTSFASLLFGDGVAPSPISSLGGSKAAARGTPDLARSRLDSSGARELICVGRMERVDSQREPWQMQCRIAKRSCETAE
jgi:hypothetical protein